MGLLHTLTFATSLLSSVAQSYNVQCFSGTGCGGAAGAIKTAPETGNYCVNTGGRQSCRLWNHQGPGGGAGLIQYLGCINCPSNCDANTCQQSYVGTSGWCVNIDPDYPGAQFRAASIQSCDL